MEGRVWNGDGNRDAAVKTERVCVCRFATVFLFFVSLTL